MANVADAATTLAIIVLDAKHAIVSATPAAIALGLSVGAHFTPGADQLVAGRIVATIATIATVADAASSEPTGSTVVTLVDLTERTIAARRAELAERRLDYIGTANSIAHQINNPLGIINIHAELIKDDVLSLHSHHRGDAKLYTNIAESLAELEAAVATVTQLTADMRAFSQPMLGATHQLRRAVDWALHTSASELRDRAFAVTELTIDGAIAMTEPDLGRLLVHLLRNAARSIPAGAAPDHQVTITARGAATPGRVIIEIRDTGVGIAAERLATIFEPALSYRDGAIHVGLGLSECRDLARKAGGDITIASLVAAGTVVTVELPLGA